MPVVASGDLAFRDKVNRQAAFLEALCRHALGAYCLLEGCAVSSPSGLTVQVATGLAVVDSVVSLASPVSYVVPASQTAVYLWLKSDGTVTHTLTTTPPAGKAAYLGQVATSGSAVTAIDTDGVIWARGGSLWRVLPSAPADSPGADVRLFTRVGTAVYLWDGAGHRLLT
jgi:hypothetical protein